ncbi:MAG TPA: T9SS type A sorting domain-containing protein [Candidatus Kapabacteria bacterium]|jgi:hypothetical protein
MMKRHFCILILFVLGFSPIASAQSPLIFQNDTVFHSVVDRLVYGGAGFQNASYTRDLRIKDMYFAHQSDSIFIVDSKFTDFDFVLPSQSFSSIDFRFRSPKMETTVYDTLITVCEYTDDSTNIFYLRRPYVGTTTSDSSSDSARVCVYGHDCNFLDPVNIGDTAFGVLCYELEFIPYDTVSIYSIHFTGRDSASFHLIDSTFPKVGDGIVSFHSRISAPYYFTPDRTTGVKRYTATAIAKMTSSDGVYCHESDIDVTGYTAFPRQDTIPVNLFGSDSLALHFSVDSTIFSHVLVFKNNSSFAIKIDNAFTQPGDCFAYDWIYPDFGSRIEQNGYFWVGLHYHGDSTFAGEDCSDTLYISEEGIQSILRFPMHQGVLQAARVGNSTQDIHLSLNPNPSNGPVDIETGSNGTLGTIDIYDILGNLVAHHIGSQWQWDGMKMNGVPVPNGIYIVRISSNGRAASQRFVMER